MNTFLVGIFRLYLPRGDVPTRDSPARHGEPRTRTVMGAFEPSRLRVAAAVATWNVIAATCRQAVARGVLYRPRSKVRAAVAESRIIFVNLVLASTTTLSTRLPLPHSAGDGCERRPRIRPWQSAIRLHLRPRRPDRAPLRTDLGTGQAQRSTR